jgi:hypothetical protein
MSDPPKAEEPTAYTARPLPIPHPRRRTWFVPGLIASAVAITIIAIPIYLIWAGYFRTIGQQTAYNRVNKATQTLVTALGLDPAQHPTFATVTHCDNGMGGYHHWSLDGTTSLHVPPDQALALAKRLEARLLMTGHLDARLTVKGPQIRVDGHLDDAQIYLDYSPADYKDELIVGASTKCEVAVGPHDFDHDTGFPLTDNQGHLLPSPGYGTPTG